LPRDSDGSVWLLWCEKFERLMTFIVQLLSCLERISKFIHRISLTSRTTFQAWKEEQIFIECFSKLNF